MRLIEDYAIIGDCRSAALLSRDGSIDWLCWPRFDSPSIFGALLDERAGSWKIAPTSPFRVERRYVENTNVLQTRFQTVMGSLLVTDLMPVASEDEKQHMLQPEHEILRFVECDAGQVEVEMVLDPRPGYGLEKVRIRGSGKLGVCMETPSGLLVLRTDLPLRSPEPARICGSGVLRAGEAFHFSLTLAEDGPAVLPPLGEWSRESQALLGQRRKSRLGDHRRP